MSSKDVCVLASGSVIHIYTANVTAQGTVIQSADGDGSPASDMHASKVSIAVLITNVSESCTCLGIITEYRVHRRAVAAATAAGLLPGVVARHELGRQTRNLRKMK